MYYFIINEVGFTKSLIAVLTLSGYLALFGGSGFYNRYLKKIDYPKIMFWSQIIIAFVISINYLFVSRISKEYLHINDLAFCLFTDVFAEIPFQGFVYMPTFVVQAKIIPKSIEATVFAIFMSLSNLSQGVISPLFGATLATFFGVTGEDFSRLPLLVII